MFIPDLKREGFDRYDVAEGESLGFVFPIYSWAAPRLVEDFVLGVRWNGNPRHVWFACTCGDEAGMVGKLFGKTLDAAGLRLDSGFSFIMPETYLCMPGFHLDTPEMEQKKIAAARLRLPEVAARIRACEKVMDITVGSMPRLKSYVIRAGFNASVSDKGYHVLDSCIGCGKCAEVCPLENIRLVDGKPQWQGGCTQCMACYQYCPTNAIQFGNCTKGKGQYHFK